MEDADRAVIRELVAALGSDETVVAETVRSVLATVPGYEGVPTASLEASARRNLGLSMRTIQDGRAPNAEQIDTAETLVIERMAQDISIGTVLAGFRVSMSVIQRRLLELAPSFGLPPSEALSFSNLLWSLGDAFSTRAVVVHQERSIAQAVADNARRARWIIDAVVTGMHATDLQRGAAAYGVPADRPVRALCSSRRTRDDDPTAPVQDWARRARARAFTAPHGESAVGILVGDPPDSLVPEGLAVALGPAVALGELPVSFTVATRVLEAAHRVGQDGVVDVERLSWRMGVGTSPETTAMLLRRHVAPVRAEGDFGELVLESVRAYLGHGLSIPRAAASIPVYVNTLRYRLKRFRELTGNDLHHPDALIEVSWALAADAGTPRDEISPDRSASFVAGYTSDGRRLKGRT